MQLAEAALWKAQRVLAISRDLEDVAYFNDNFTQEAFESYLKEVETVVETLREVILEKGRQW